MPAGEGRHEKVLSITARQSEKELIERAADVAGTSVNRFGRQALLDAARERLRQYLRRVLEERPDGSGRERTPEKVVAGE